jgi:hypothetical protein
VPASATASVPASVTASVTASAVTNTVIAHATVAQPRVKPVIRSQVGANPLRHPSPGTQNVRSQFCKTHQNQQICLGTWHAPTSLDLVALRWGSVGTGELVMRYLFRFLCVCALGLVPLVGCAENGTGGCPDPLGPYDPRCFCPAQLSDYCEGSDCPTLDQAVADAMKFAQDNCFGVGCSVPGAGAGRCGDFRYVYTSCGEGYTTRQYFDASGTLRVVGICSDTTEFCNGALLCIRYGPDPDCAFEPAKDYCETSRDD